MDVAVAAVLSELGSSDDTSPLLPPAPKAVKATQTNNSDWSAWSLQFGASTSGSPSFASLFYFANAVYVIFTTWTHEIKSKYSGAVALQRASS